MGIANRLIEDARALESDALGATTLCSGDGLAHAIVYESGALEFRRGAFIGDGKPVAKDDALNTASRFVTNGGGLPSDAVPCSVIEIRRTRVGQPHASSESIAWAVEYRQFLGSLPVYGQNVIRVLVAAGGVTAYDRMWLPASSTPSSETLPSEAAALAQALQAVDRCQGTPDVVGLERCLWRESVRDTLIRPAWRIDFSDGQIVYVTDSGCLL